MNAQLVQKRTKLLINLLHIIKEYVIIKVYCFSRKIEVCPSKNVPGYCIVKGNVKPRTNAKDPVTKKSTYSTWIILKSTDKGAIHSAMCTCKGG